MSMVDGTHESQHGTRPASLRTPQAHLLENLMPDESRSFSNATTKQALKVKKSPVSQKKARTLNDV
jgi:hypothetical protein